MGDFIQQHLGVVISLVCLAPIGLGLFGWVGFRYWTLARRYSGIIDIDRERARREADLASIRKEYSDKRQILDRLKEAVSTYEGIVEASDYGLYSPHFSFDTSEEYKRALGRVRGRQKEMIRGKQAAVCRTEWKVAGSLKEGGRMTKRYIQLVLRAFNGECDSLVANVKWNNIRQLEDRLEKAFQAINQLGESLDITICPDYYLLKLDELRLTHEHAEKKYEEKEEQRAIREAMREEERVQKEVRSAEQKAIEDERRYEKALARARSEVERIDNERADEMRREISRLESLLAESRENRTRAISRAQLTRSGHVYVISNLGSFGENLYKIGMTRRLEPLDRVTELGDASVPFRFDVHALIYSEDAPELERKLHQEFRDRRRNRVNERKEFFEVTLDEIRAAVEKHHGEIEFTRYAEAREYRETISMRSEERVSSVVNGFGEEEFPLEI